MAPSMAASLLVGWPRPEPHPSSRRAGTASGRRRYRRPSTPDAARSCTTSCPTSPRPMTQAVSPSWHLRLTDALHRDRADRAECRELRRHAVRHRHAQIHRHPVPLGMKGELIAGAGHELADREFFGPLADRFDDPGQRVPERRVGVQPVHHLAVGADRPLLGHACRATFLA